MVDKKNIPEPPKFSLDDLPEPPKLEPDSDIDVPEIHDKKIDIPFPEPPEAEEKEPLKKEPSLSSLPSQKSGLDSFPEPPKLEQNTESLKEPMVSLPSQKDDLDDFPEPPKLEEIKQKKGLFSGLFGKKKQKTETDALKPLPVRTELAQEEKIPAIPIIPEISDDKEEDMSPPWLEEGEDFRNNEMEQEAVKFKEDEMLKEAEDFMLKDAKTPLSEVKGVGPAREKKLKKAGIKTAEHLALTHHKKVADKIKIPESSAKKIVSHAKKITKIKSKLNDIKKSDSISDVIKKLEQERKSIEKIKKSKNGKEDKLMKVEDHKEIVEVLEKLEKKRSELSNMQLELDSKEKSIKDHDFNYRRDLEYIDNLKRRLDHDIRERTQHLINMEKQYFERAQKIVRQQSEVEIKEKALSEKESFLKQRDIEVRKKLNEMNDRELTIETKEKKLTAMMNDLEKQDVVLKEKEEDLVKRESEYLKKLDILENHEKTILNNLEEKRHSLEKKEKELKLREERLHKTQRNVDKKEVAVEYAKNIVEEEKGKLVDDEFEQYLHDELNKMNSMGISRSNIDMVSNLNIPGLEKQSRTIYQLINQCKDMLSKNKVDEAKMYYNQVRDRYYQGGFSGKSEKEAVHNMIRSLYDEINLADIGRNR